MEARDALQTAQEAVKRLGEYEKQELVGAIVQSMTPYWQSVFIDAFTSWVLTKILHACDEGRLPKEWIDNEQDEMIYAAAVYAVFPKLSPKAYKAAKVIVNNLSKQSPARKAVEDEMRQGIAEALAEMRRQDRN